MIDCDPLTFWEWFETISNLRQFGLILCFGFTLVGIIVFVRDCSRVYQRMFK